MKRFIILAAMFCTLFGTTAFAAKESITDEKKVSEILANYYPTLKSYYDAGVIEIESLQEETLADGETKYDIKYKLVKNYYDESEIDGVLKEQYPDIYAMKRMGIIKDVSIFKFVYQDTGDILTNVAYNKNTPQRPEFNGRWMPRRHFARR